MNLETLFPHFLLFFSFFTLQTKASTWITLGSSSYGYLADSNDRNDYIINLIAGRTYNIVMLGLNNADTILRVQDPSGYSTGNDDWAGSSYYWSSIVNFVPIRSGICTISATTYSSNTYYYLLIVERSGCSGSCTSKPFS